jgi:hypothetical protein
MPLWQSRPLRVELLIAHLAHEVGDDPVEGRVLESESLLAGAQRTEVLGSLRHHVVPKLKRDQICLKLPDQSVSGL